MVEESVKSGRVSVRGGGEKLAGQPARVDERDWEAHSTFPKVALPELA